MAKNPSPGNPGYYQVQVTLPDGTKRTQVYRDDGAPAYYTDTKPDGTQSTVYPAAAAPNGDGKIATPGGASLYNSETGQPVGAPKVDSSIGTNFDAQANQITNDPGGSLVQVKDDLDKLNPVGTPGLNNDQADKDISDFVNGKKGAVDSAKDFINNGSSAGGSITGGGSVTGGGGAGGTGTLGSLPATQEADAFAKKLIDERNADAPRAAPQATAGTIDLSKVPQAGPAATYTGAPTVAPKEEAVTPAVAGGFGVGSVSGGSITPDKIDTTKNQIDLGGEARDAQVRALNLAEGAANGTAPSAAEALLRKGIDEGVGSQLGVAASLQGRNPASALRAGLAGAANVTAKSSADMASLRADEMAQARRDFLSGSTSLRNSDVDVQKSNQDTVLQANLGNLSADTQSKIASLNSQTSAAIASLNAQVAAGQANLAAQTQVTIANLQAESQRVHDDAFNELQTRLQNGSLSEDAFKATLASNTQLTAANIDAMVKAMTTNANNTTQTNISNSALSLDSRKLDDLLKGTQGDQIIAALGLPIGAAKQDIANAIAAQASSNSFWASVLSAIGTYAAS